MVIPDRYHPLIAAVEGFYGVRTPLAETLGEYFHTFRNADALIDGFQTTLLRKGEVKFLLKDAALHATNVTLFAQVEFKTAGTYYVEVLVDDVMKLRYPVPVILAPQPNQPPAPPPPPAPPAPTACIHPGWPER